MAGVSGGPDSLCLMETLRRAGYSVIVAYFDHQLRPESGADARMVEKTANRLMLSCFVDGADVRAHAEEKKLSIEEAARKSGVAAKGGGRAKAAKATKASKAGPDEKPLWLEDVLTSEQVAELVRTVRD